MTRLSSLLPFNDGETVASYASRLAAACGYRHARSFGADLKFRFQGLAVGNQSEIESFASILDVSPELLEPGVVRTGKTGKTDHLVLGETLSRMQLQRQCLRFCPFCVEDDERSCGGRRGHRAYGRLQWLVTGIRTCKRHGVRLLTCEPVRQPVFLHDFAANLAAEKASLGFHKRTARRADADPLQTYIEARLERRPTDAAWLDSQPLHVAIRLCEIVGATERHGLRFNSNLFDEAEVSACAGIGFDVLQGGEDSLKNYLVACTQRFYEHSSGDFGGRAVFGRFYERLAHEITDSAYDPIRHIMREVALDHLPLGPGDEFFGPVTERRLHSVQSASKEFGIHPKRLRKLLVNLEAIPPEDAAKSYERVLLPAAELQRICFEAGGSISVPEAKDRLGVGRVPFELLVSHGLIVPHGGARGDTARPVDRRFPAKALDELLERLQAAVNSDDDGTLCDLAAAAKRADCTFIEIIQLLLGGGLTRVARAAGSVCIGSLRVDPAEVKERTKGEEHGCLNLRSLEKLLPAKSSVIKALVDEGHLLSVQRKNPVKRNMQTVVEPAELERFRQKYVSLGSLSITFETRTWTLADALERKEILPAFTAAGSAFYRRAQVDGLKPNDLVYTRRKRQKEVQDP